MMLCLFYTQPLNVVQSTAFTSIHFKSDLTIVCRIDLNDSSISNDGRKGGNGHIPMWLYVKTVGRTGAASMSAMRKELVKERVRQSKKHGKSQK